MNRIELSLRNHARRLADDPPGRAGGESPTPDLLRLPPGTGRHAGEPAGSRPQVRLPSPLRVLLLASAYLGLARSATALPAQAPKSGPEGPPFAVVELFTSEGCSSCPPADELLAKVISESRARSEAVYALAFHVDYWNGLGWKDRFSEADYTRRQAEYSRAFGQDGAYTPQMIVNGREEFVGSDEGRLRRSLSAALQRPAAASITLSAGSAHAGVLPVDFTILGRAGAVLHLAVVERNLFTHVGGGENSGRRLRHENVVRAFESLTPGPTGKGHAELQLPSSLVLANASLIGYLQDSRSQAILGASSVELR